MGEPQAVGLGYGPDHGPVRPRVGPEHVVGEVGALPQLLDAQGDPPDARVETALAVAVAAVALAQQLVGLLRHHGVEAVLQEPAGQLVQVDAAVLPARDVLALGLPFG